MEKEPFENKMMRDIKDTVETVSNSFEGAMKGIDAKLKKELGEKGFARWKAYTTKYMSLIENGKEAEALELEKTFLSGK